MVFLCLPFITIIHVEYILTKDIIPLINLKLNKLTFNNFSRCVAHPLLHDCNEWKTEKCHEYTNMGQIQTTQIMTAAVHCHFPFINFKISGCLIFVGLSVHTRF